MVLAGLCRVRAAEQKGAVICRGVGAPGGVQTLKVFLADSGNCLQDCLASHDDGSRGKPLGSFHAIRLYYKIDRRLPDLETCGRVFGGVRRPLPSVNTMA